MVSGMAAAPTDSHVFQSHLDSQGRAPGLIINANQNAFASEFGCEFSNDDFSQFLCSPIRDFSQDITLDERVTALEKSLQLAMQ